MTLTAFAAIVFAAINTSDEGYGLRDSIIISLNWSVGPLAILIVYRFGAAIARDSSVGYWQAILLVGVYACSYSFYAFNGSSSRKGPENAAHVHVILVPLIMALPTTLGIAHMLWHSMRVAKSVQERDEDVHD